MDKSEKKQKPRGKELSARIGVSLTPKSVEIAPGVRIHGIDIKTTVGDEKETELLPTFAGEWTEVERFVLETFSRVVEEGRIDDMEYFDGLLIKTYDKETLEDAIQSIMEKTGMVWEQECPHCNKYLIGWQEPTCPYCGKNLAE